MEAHDGMPYLVLWDTKTWVHMLSKDAGERPREEGAWLAGGPQEESVLPRWIAAAFAGGRGEG